MAEKMICLPNSKTIMMKLMQSRLENIMKSKVMREAETMPSVSYPEGREIQDKDGGENTNEEQ